MTQQEHGFPLLEAPLEIPITHTGSYEWQSDPIDLPEKLDHASISWSVVGNGTADVQIEALRPGEDDDGRLVVKVAFTVDRFTGSPTFEVPVPIANTPMKQPPGTAESD